MRTETRSMDIDEAVVLVTGASSGIGAATARAAAQAVLPIMREQAAGSIVDVSSGITFRALPGSAAYGASKAGLTNFPSWRDAGSAVSTTYPFITDADLTESLRGDIGSASQLESSHAPKPQLPEHEFPS